MAPTMRSARGRNETAAMTRQIVSEQAYLQLVLAEPEAHWELLDGEPRRRPPMTSRHEDFTVYLGAALVAQLPRDQYRVRIANSRVRRSPQWYFVPDVTVVPTALVLPQQETSTAELFSDPVPLVVEIWSPSTGAYDRQVKLAEYQARGDQEIWLIHPFEHTLNAWRRTRDGQYEESVYTGGVVEIASLPGVRINLDDLFE